MGIAYFIIVLYFCRKLQYILNALKASLFLFKRMRQNKLNIMVGTIFSIVFTIFMLLSVVSAASYGPDEKIPAEGISGRFIKQFVPNKLQRWLLWVDVIAIYFIYLFLISLTEMVTCLSTCSWYFTRKKESANMPTFSVVTTVYRYHCGTLAKVSLYKLCFKFFRNTAHILRSLLRNSKQDNNFVRFLMATFLPVISFYEKYLKYITKDLFVMVAMYGLEYLTASRKDFLMVKFRPNREA